MDNQQNQVINLFWSWQSDSPSKENRNFIEDALKQAIKKLGRENAILINVDRDTKNVGGTPVIAETILGKIRGSDIFIWDATLVYEYPKPSPNPNVLFELGYAQAAIGDGRTIGVMNVANGLGGDKLPFDLAHRRWPITYNFRSTPDLSSLSPEEIEKANRLKTAQRNKLTETLAEAIMTALKEEKVSLNTSNIDFIVTSKLWAFLDSNWLTSWANVRLNNPQFETNKTIEKLQSYLWLSKLPEYQYKNKAIVTAHKKVLEALSKHLSDSSMEMIPDGDEACVLSIKRQGWVENYDQEYDRQLKVVVNGIRNILDCWKEYIQSIRDMFPEIIITGIA